MTTSRSRIALAALLLTAAITFLTAALADAAGVVENCNDDGALRSVLIGGGTVSFDCNGRGDFATIELREEITIDVATSIDGGGKVTLSGRDANRLFHVSQGASLDLRSIELERGFSKGDGGAVYNAGFLALDGATIRDSNAAFKGGAIVTTGRIDITDGTLRGNAALNGGALAATGAQAQVTIANSALYENKADATQFPDGSGGAILTSSGARLNVYSSDLVGNTANVGGAIANVDAGSSSSLVNSTVDDNQAAAGAGIFNLGGTIDLSIVTVSNNRATVTGGGIKNESGMATLVNVTISGNSAFGGGGLYNYNATANLTNVTVANNTARNIGGGISNSSALDPHLNLKNVLIADSPAGGNCYLGKPPGTSQFNLSSDDTCSFGPGRDGLPLAIGPLESNGGETLTHRLLPLSRAIDAGTTVGCPSMDQRFVRRSYGHSCDVGAVEFVPCEGPPTRPLPLSPGKRDIIQDLRPVLDWAGPDCAERFSVVVREVNRKGPIVFTADDIAATEVEADLLLDRHRYAWRVTACNELGCTAGPWRKFKIVEN
ncbi:MAG TPA: choice-of-anchor Q domain-containing protein [Candidatus Binatia bacterium]|nr:choice-of-anchor Q domain-containing protein [Candidatus Binatia bacterium]